MAMSYLPGSLMECWLVMTVSNAEHALSKEPTFLGAHVSHVLGQSLFY
jgi:hypothetical protein